MPLYTFTSQSTGASKDIFFLMKDVPSIGAVFIDPTGHIWKRVTTKPGMNIDTRVDPYSSKDFIKATSKKDCVGSMWDRSKELSLKRADKDGIDKVKQAYYTDYSKRRHGAKHRGQRREETTKKLSNAGIKIDWGDDD